MEQASASQAQLLQHEEQRTLSEEAWEKIAMQSAQVAAHARKIEQAEAKKRAEVVSHERTAAACEQSVAVGPRVVSFESEPTLFEYTCPRGKALRASRRTVTRGLRRKRQRAKERTDAESPKEHTDAE